MTEKTAISYLSKAVMLMTDEQIKELISAFADKDKLYFILKASEEATRRVLEAHELKCPK